MKTLEQRLYGGEVEVKTWFERDRSHVSVDEADTDETIAEWWDEDVQQMYEDGFFKGGGRELERSVVTYLDEVGAHAYPKGEVRYALYGTDEDGKDHWLHRSPSIRDAMSRGRLVLLDPRESFASAWIWDSRTGTGTPVPSGRMTARERRALIEELPRRERGMFR
jgi:hypothetical protein